MENNFFAQATMVILAILLALVMIFMCVIIICDVISETQKDSSPNFTLNEIENFIYTKDGVLYLYNGHNVAPYLVYADGQLYGAIYQDGEIIPVPFAIGDNSNDN